jgi:hypothetical protein
MTKNNLSYPMFVLFIWLTGLALAQEQAPEPVFKDGDTWQINITRKDQPSSSTTRVEGSYEVSYTQGKVRIFEADGTKKTELIPEPESPAEGLLGIIGKNERRPDLKFPLSVGKKWDYQLVQKLGGGRPDQRRSVEVSVVALEQVTTPAGSFKAYKLVRNESWTGGGRSVVVNNSTSTFFYSPEARSIVKRVTENSNNPATTTIELIKFTPGN